MHHVKNSNDTPLRAKVNTATVGLLPVSAQYLKHISIALAIFKWGNSLKSPKAATKLAQVLLQMFMPQQVWSSAETDAMITLYYNTTPELTELLMADSLTSVCKGTLHG